MRLYVVASIALIVGCAKRTQPIAVQVVPSDASSAASSSSGSTPGSARAPVSDTDAGSASAEAVVPAACASFSLLETGPCSRWIGFGEKDRSFFGSLTVGVEAAHVSVKVTVEPQPAKVGAPITVVVTYTNESDRPIALDFRQGDQSKKRGDNLFGYSVLDKKAEPAEVPPGPSPCCPPGNTSDFCGDVPLENPSLTSSMPLRALFLPHGQAKIVATLPAPTRKKYGPKSTFCQLIELGPLLPGEYTMAVELPLLPNVKGSFAREARTSFSMTK